MKKFLFVLLAMGSLWACTTPEEDAQIKLFWLEQLMQFMPQSARPVSLPSEPLPTQLPVEEPPVPVEEQPPVREEENAKTPTLSVNATTVSKAVGVAKTPRVIEAMLFVSPSCPRCQRLKKEGWVTTFEDAYRGRINLTQYDLSIPKNEELLDVMMRKHKLTHVNYPTLFIDGNVVQGYPLNAEPVVKRVLSKYGWDQVASVSQQQFMEITLEDSSRVNKVKSNASLKDRQAMQRALDRVKQSNQQTLQDIGFMFDGDTQVQAFAIVSKSEKILMRTANTSNNYQNYLNAQQKILQEQEAQLNQLMRANAYKLRRVRG